MDPKRRTLKMMIAQVLLIAVGDVGDSIRIANRAVFRAFAIDSSFSKVLSQPVEYTLAQASALWECDRSTHNLDHFAELSSKAKF